ncbi:MAG: VOC family protein [Acidimicrobiales bacterium]
MTGTHDPFDDLASPIVPHTPDPRFVGRLRARLVDALGLDPAALDPAAPAIALPERKPMTTTSRPDASPASSVTASLTPYLAVDDGAAALAWYVEVLGAVEQMRVVGDDGRIGHAEIMIGGARLYLSDEYPEIGVTSPRTLGGTALALHLDLGAGGPGSDVDATFARAVEAGATPLAPPADQPHGARHGTLVDPYGHRWMLSQQVEALTVDEYARRSAGTGYEVVGPLADETVTAADRPGTGGGIWANVHYRDPLAAIRFLVDTFGFEEQLVVTGDDGTTVVHSQLRWPEGGIVQVGTVDPANPFAHDPGEQSLYVVTADPMAVWERTRTAEVEAFAPPHAPDYDPEGSMFTVRDPEGNLWTFGSYGLGES